MYYFARFYHTRQAVTAAMEAFCLFAAVNYIKGLRVDEVTY